jgi:CheY-like chemotaxis protein/HPt (histidine-containing phosphotransfer) domain-containing protein
VKLVLLTSFGQRGHGAEAVRIGVSGYLTKPVDEADLHDCLVDILGGAPGARGRSLITRHSLRETRPSTGARVLVAEDNEVNQKVAIRILEKLGYRADVAENGLEVVEALDKVPYDAILMDVQMPRMDGYEATARVRAREGEARHTPIVAMTARALKGDREKCLAAGMDDYISKPVNPQELRAILARLVPRAPAPRESAALSEESPAAVSPIDESVIANLRNIDPDGSLLREVVDTFIRIAPLRLATLWKASQKPDAGSLERAAHSFRGSCANLGARRMADICARLEDLGRTGSTEGSRELVEALEADYEGVRLALEAEKERSPSAAAAGAPDPADPP